MQYNRLQKLAKIIKKSEKNEGSHNSIKLN